jgi:hypothetical protein
VGGLEDSEQFQDHGRHAAKMPGPALSLERRGYGSHVDRRLGAARVHLLDRGDEQQVAAGLGQQRLVALQVARIAGEILVWPELRRVHEQARRHAIVVRAGAAHEREVAFVQVAHRGHQTHAVGRGAAPPPHLGDRLDGFHHGPIGRG